MEIFWQVVQLVGGIALLFAVSLVGYSLMTPEERASNARAMDEFLYGEAWRD
jgi:hypothetical protein